MIRVQKDKLRLNTVEMHWSEERSTRFNSTHDLCDNDCSALSSGSWPLSFFSYFNFIAA